MFAQLWHTGRSSHVSMTGGAAPVSASVNPAYWEDPKRLVSTSGGWVQPSPHRALDRSEMPGIVGEYHAAAARAKAAGFDGVELHAANGYLIDQFLQDGSNHVWTSTAARSRTARGCWGDVVGALASVWGGERVAVRVGPGGTWNGMGDSDPHALFDHVAERLNAFGLAYLHVVEPRVGGNVLVAEGQGPVAAERLRRVFAGRIVAAGGFEPDTAEAIVEQGDADLVSFGRYFVSNPDLPDRIAHRWPLAPYDRQTFYTFDARLHGLLRVPRA